MVVPVPADLKKSQACGRTGFLINRQKSFCRGAAWRIIRAMSEWPWPFENGKVVINHTTFGFLGIFRHSPKS